MGFGRQIGSSMRKNIYVDLGAYTGDSVKEFKNWIKAAYGEKKWEIYAFEPNPKLLINWRKMTNEHTHFEQAAAWTYDGEIEFAVDNTLTPRGSTVMQSKVAIWDTMPHIQVKCFDLSKWLEQFKDDLLVVKMDIEGAEFPILEKMITDGTIYIPDKLMVEFHPNKVRDYTTTYKEDLIKRIKNLGVELLEWH